MFLVFCFLIKNGEEFWTTEIFATNFIENFLTYENQDIEIPLQLSENEIQYFKSEEIEGVYTREEMLEKSSWTCKFKNKHLKSELCDCEKNLEELQIQSSKNNWEGRMLQKLKSLQSNFSAKGIEKRYEYVNSNGHFQPLTRDEYKKRMGVDPETEPPRYACMTPAGKLSFKSAEEFDKVKYVEPEKPKKTKPDFKKKLDDDYHSDDYHQWLRED